VGADRGRRVEVEVAGVDRLVEGPVVVAVVAGGDRLRDREVLGDDGAGAHVRVVGVVAVGEDVVAPVGGLVLPVDAVGVQALVDVARGLVRWDEVPSVAELAVAGHGVADVLGDVAAAGVGRGARRRGEAAETGGGDDPEDGADPDQTPGAWPVQMGGHGKSSFRERCGSGPRDDPLLAVHAALPGGGADRAKRSAKCLREV
jgi:hypothetical protein